MTFPPPPFPAGRDPLVRDAPAHSDLGRPGERRHASRGGLRRRRSEAAGRGGPPRCSRSPRPGSCATTWPAPSPAERAASPAAGRPLPCLAPRHGVLRPVPAVPVAPGGPLHRQPLAARALLGACPTCRLRTSHVRPPSESRRPCTDRAQSRLRTLCGEGAPVPTGCAPECTGGRAGAEYRDAARPEIRVRTGAPSRCRGRRCRRPTVSGCSGSRGRPCPCRCRRLRRQPRFCPAPRSVTAAAA